jgi:protein gp37
MNNSKIEWTEKSWNPVTGCTKVSAGCENCYANRLATTRLKHLPEYKDGFYGNVQCHPKRLDEPVRMKKPKMIFVNSMGDLFHPDVPFEFIDQVFEVMTCDATQHIYQILTKHPDRLLEYCRYASDIIHAAGYEKINGWAFEIPDFVWIGVSIESDGQLQRKYFLDQVPAKTKFISFEPLLGAISINYSRSIYNNIDWIIVGGETGPNYRDMDPEWVEIILSHCITNNIPFFMKQWSGRKPIPTYLDQRQYPKMNNEVIV